MTHGNRVSYKDELKISIGSFWNVMDDFDLDLDMTHSNRVSHKDELEISIVHSGMLTMTLILTSI